MQHSYGCGVSDVTSTIEDVDQDLRCAVAQREVAFRRLAIRDDAPNREAYAKARAWLDALLDMRHEMRG